MAGNALTSHSCRYKIKTFDTYKTEIHDIAMLRFLKTAATCSAKRSSRVACRRGSRALLMVVRAAISWSRLSCVVFGQANPAPRFNVVMIQFTFPNSRAPLPTFGTNCTDGPHFAQMGSHFAENTTPNPCSLLSRHTPLSGMCTHTKYPQAHL